MKRIMLLPITLPLRVAALQLRLARGAAAPASVPAVRRARVRCTAARRRA